jgi:hypothetical protein
MPEQATATATFSPPETVTIPGKVALEILALLDAYAELCAGFRLDGEPDPFFTIEDPIWQVLRVALGEDPKSDLDSPLWDAMKEWSSSLQQQIRERFDGPTLGAIAMTKMAGDIAEVKARLEFSFPIRVRQQTPAEVV